ncbi:MAG: serine/threonine protein kinase [Deltaproteobacteria bacterium]|nr:serine/threonine protein kinase [Deltaproteobacteria bacterium]
MKKPRPFGKYYLLERVNVGGMAEVFKAKQFGSDGFEKIVAIKRILPNIAEDEEFIMMFRDEAMISVQLTHPNIAQITDLNKVDDVYYIAMEYVHGKDVRTIFERCRADRNPMTLAQSCFIVMKVCEALDYAHNKKDAKGIEIGIVHRDISPQNVLISYEGDVKVIDFGIAKAAGKASKTQAGILKGKFGYMSPEQVRGNMLDRRSDIFSLGIVLYELLTNERLFIGESDFSTLEKVRNVEILPPSTYNRKIPEQLESIVLKALAKEVEDRYQTAGDFHDELQAFMYTSGEFYSRKDLSAWMKKSFAKELDEEKGKLEEYSKFKPDEHIIAASEQQFSMLDDPTYTPNVNPQIMNNPVSTGGDDWWEDDEVETALYDKPENQPNHRGKEKSTKRVGKQPKPTMMGMGGIPEFPDVTEKPEIGQPGHAFGAQQPVAQQSFAPRQGAVGSKELNAARNQSYMSGPMAAVNPTDPSLQQPLQPHPQYPSEAASGGGGRTALIVVTAVASIIMAAVLFWYFQLRKPPVSDGEIEINVNPSTEVSVKLNGSEIKDASGNKIKKFPFRLKKKSGTYDLEISAKGYVTWREKVSVETKVINKLNIVLKTDTFKMFVDGKPSGAVVSVDGTAFSEKTPWKGMDITSGKHTVLISSGDSYHPHKVVTEKKAGEILNIAYDLVPRKVTITVNTLTKGAKICIVNDQNKVPTVIDCPIADNVPYEFTTAPDTKYFLKIVKNNYKTFSTAIKFDGKTTWSLPLAVALEKNSSGTTLVNNGTNNTVNTNNGGTYVMPPPMIHIAIMHPMVMDPKPPVMVKPPMTGGGSGVLRINARPRSQIYVDGAQKGWTPKKLNLSAGSHKVTLINNAQGLKKTIYVKINPGKSITRVVRFP